MSPRTFELSSFAAYFCTQHDQLDGLYNVAVDTAREALGLLVPPVGEKIEFLLKEEAAIFESLADADESILFEFARAYKANVVERFPEFHYKFHNGYEFGSKSDTEPENEFSYQSMYLDDEDQWVHKFVELISKKAYKAELGFRTDIPKDYLDEDLHRELYMNGLCLFVPFLYTHNYWVFPRSNNPQLNKLIKSHLADCGSCNISCLTASLSKKGRYVSTAFAKFLVFNNPDFLLHPVEQGLRISKIDEHWSKFSLRAKAISRTSLKAAINGDRKELNEIRRRFTLWTENKVLKEDLADSSFEQQLLAKILEEHDKVENEIQGMPESIHNAICNLLLKTRHALPYFSLCRALGVDSLPINPSNLPFGRILAYGRRLMDQEKQHAHFVLIDWVASERVTRGKIVPNRIITPLVEKKIDFSANAPIRALEQDPYYLAFGLFDGFSIAKRIGARLPGMPTELYYVTQIHKRLKKDFFKGYLELGKGWLGVDRGIQFRKVSETTWQWKRRYCRSVFNVLDDRELLERIHQLADDYPALLTLIR